MRLIRNATLALALAACSSATSSAGFGAAEPSGGPIPDVSFDASAPTARLPACPTAWPGIGEDCNSLETTACEYGTNALAACNDVFVCDQSSQRWREHSVGNATCGGPCPYAFDEIAPGGACSEPGTVCSYYEATCGCVADATDAGGPDAGTSGTWACTRPAFGCPARRPRLGESCVHGMHCDYGSCLFGAALAVDCTRTESGVVAWTAAASPACP